MRCILLHFTAFDFMRYKQARTALPHRLFTHILSPPKAARSHASIQINCSRNVYVLLQSLFDSMTNMKSIWPDCWTCGNAGMSSALLERQAAREHSKRKSKHVRRADENPSSVYDMPTLIWLLKNDVLVPCLLSVYYKWVRLRQRVCDGGGAAWRGHGGFDDAKS